MYTRRHCKDEQLRWPGGTSVCFGSCRLGFYLESSQASDFNFGSKSFPASRSALKRQYVEQAGKFTCAVGKGA